MTQMLENHMVIPTTRWSGSPNDPNAPEETRPDDCECRNIDGDGHDDPASEHDPENEECPLNWPDDELAEEADGRDGPNHDYECQCPTCRGVDEVPI